MDNVKQISIVRIAAIAAIGGFLFGYDTGVIGGTQLFFTEHFALSPGMQGWVVSSAVYACGFGALMAGYLTKAIGRKNTMLLSAVLFSVSAWGFWYLRCLIRSWSFIESSVWLGIGLDVYGGTHVHCRGCHHHNIVDAWSLCTSWPLYSDSSWFFLATYFIGGGDSAVLSEGANKRGVPIQFESRLACYVLVGATSCRIVFSFCCF